MTQNAFTIVSWLAINTRLRTLISIIIGVVAVRATVAMQALVSRETNSVGSRGTETQRYGDTESGADTCLWVECGTVATIVQLRLTTLSLEMFHHFHDPATSGTLSLSIGEVSAMEVPVPEVLDAAAATESVAEEQLTTSS